MVIVVLLCSHLHNPLLFPRSCILPLHKNLYGYSIHLSLITSQLLKGNEIRTGLLLLEKSLLSSIGAPYVESLWCATPGFCTLLSHGVWHLFNCYLAIVFSHCIIFDHCNEFFSCVSDR